MTDNLSRKCFKVSYLKERDLITTFEGDVVYVRSHPYVYLNIGEGIWKQFTKVYASGMHPKYNLDRLVTLEEPHMFKIEIVDGLDSVPAKHGDLIYRNGDPFMYMVDITDSVTSYMQIVKM